MDNRLEVCRTIAECRRHVKACRLAGDTIALVPTMGFLHDGHMQLVKRAGELADRVVVSIFVNPTQFGEEADLTSYPRDEERDLKLLKAEGVDLVFIPDVSEMYHPNDETIVETVNLANRLHGVVRPGHFRGVTTVVSRLFNIVQPDYACFGEKDYQQLHVIRRMVRDLAFPLDIVGVPTARAADGLALSSRNSRLSKEQRVAAVVLSQSLDAAAKAAKEGVDVEKLRRIISDKIASEPLARLQGLDIVEDENLTEISGALKGPTAIMISVAFGEILLIDQRVVLK